VDSYNKDYDLVVVGGGIAGIATAYLYKRRFPQHSVLVLEQKGPGRSKGLGAMGGGLTGRSGGHRMPGFEADFSALVALMGEEAALELYRETLLSSDFTDRIIDEEQIKCGSRRGYWIVDGDVKDFAKLDEFMRPRRLLGLPEPELVTGRELKDRVNFEGYSAGLYFSDIASFDTPKFIYGLAEAFQRRGGHIAEGYEYTEHTALKGAARSGKRRYLVTTACGESFYAYTLLLAGGDILTRKVPSLHKRTVTVYTGRMGTRLKEKHHRLVSRRREPLAGCDSELKSNQNPLEGDFLWFSLRQDGYLAMGFGGCFGGFTATATRENIRAMVEEVRAEIFKRLPFLKEEGCSISPTVGGVNTSSNLLPFLGIVGGEEGVFAIAAQSGVGLNQSILMAHALVEMLAGQDRLYALFQPLREDQSLMPTGKILRRAAVEVGIREKTSPSAVVRNTCKVVRHVGSACLRAKEGIQIG
jgi:glycine/D-amino acid oxidase-like deaminating enzyme